jgi:iron(III) transport system permease protein
MTDSVAQNATPRIPAWHWTIVGCAALLALLPAVYTVYRGYEAVGEVAIINGTLLWMLVKNTIAYALLAAFIAGCIGTTQALLIENGRLPFWGFWRILVALPLVIPPYVSALTFLTLLRPHGVFEKWLVINGLTEFGALPFDGIFGVFGSAFVLGSSLSPYVYFPVSAVLQSRSQHLSELARITGASTTRRIRHILLPMVLPAMGGGMLLVLLYALADFGVPALLRLPTFSTAIYARYAGSVDRGGAALLSIPLIAITALLIFVQDRFFGHGVTQINRSWKPPVTQQYSLKTVLFCVLITLSVIPALGVPLGMLLTWISSPVSAVERASIMPFGSIVSAAARTLVLSFLVATGVEVLGLLVARVLRHGGTLGYTIGRIAQIGYALPGIVVGLSVVLMLSAFVPALLGGIIPLVLALTIRFLPQAIQGMDVTLRLVTPSLEDAGRLLGQTPLGVLRYIIVPLSASGIRSTWALVFLGLLKELPATLLLRPAGFDTLAVRIWMPTSDGFVVSAAGPALALIVCAFVPFIALQWRTSEHLKTQP